MKQKRFKTQDVVVMLGQQLKMTQIARLLGVSRQALYKQLNRENVLLNREYWHDVTCAFCGKVYRKRVRLKTNQPNAQDFCSTNCYAAHRENPAYVQWRQGQRLARAIVSQHFHLEPDHIVDHRDGNNHNNDRNNLRVYANQSDHMKMHHAMARNKPERAPLPLWDGAFDV